MLDSNFSPNYGRFMKEDMRMPAAFLASAGLALMFSYAFAIFACYLGILFSGLATFFVVLVATACCAIVVPVTALIFKRKKKHFAWRTLFIEVVLLALVAVGLLSWLQTRQALEIFMKPGPVPSEMHVHRGRSILFSCYVHFSARPADIAAIIQSKELVEVPSEEANQNSLLQRTKISWDWWQPAAMFNPRFFYRHHQSDAVQGWSEGWWVNGATNEVYALISG
jgi:hypothetical protein